MLFDLRDARRAIRLRPQRSRPAHHRERDAVCVGVTRPARAARGRTRHEAQSTKSAALSIVLEPSSKWRASPSIPARAHRPPAAGSRCETPHAESTSPAVLKFGRMSIGQGRPGPPCGTGECGGFSVTSTTVARPAGSGYASLGFVSSDIPGELSRQTAIFGGATAKSAGPSATCFAISRLPRKPVRLGRQLIQMELPQTPPHDNPIGVSRQYVLIAFTLEMSSGCSNPPFRPRPTQAASTTPISEPGPASCWFTSRPPRPLSRVVRCDVPIDPRVCVCIPDPIRDARGQG
jgi:hypothetical protein